MWARNGFGDLCPSTKCPNCQRKRNSKYTDAQMQRLVDKIVNEFQQNSDYIEIGALDGNGGKTWM